MFPVVLFTFGDKIRITTKREKEISLHCGTNGKTKEMQEKKKITTQRMINISSRFLFIFLFFSFFFT